MISKFTTSLLVVGVTTYSKCPLENYLIQSNLELVYPQLVHNEFELQNEL